MKKEFHVALVQHVVDQLLVKFASEGHCTQSLSFSTCKHRRSMRHGKRTHLTPDRTNLCSLTTIKTFAFIKDTTTHGITLYIIVIPVYQSILLFHLFRSQFGMGFCISHLKVFSYLSELFFALVFVGTRTGRESISLVIASLTTSFTQFLIIHFMTIFTLNICTQFFGQFLLKSALGFDGFMSCLEGSQQILFGNLIHLTFYHHDIFLSSTHHDIHICLFHLLESRIDDIFSINACYTHFGYRRFNGNIRTSQCG